ncbi:MAG: aerobic carbon-monoxide dehydrogenase small subunit [Actinomycetota bacterium]|jgi:carbon-monoxide dehydrogenase small subunit|nr:aerobic carbon-monoxide dehydrogenase small subunit [Actinomycetota bacterium]
MTADRHPLSMTVNGNRIDLVVESRRTLAEILREDLGLTGTHLACEHGVCGACTVALDGKAVRSCLMLALQADGGAIETVESLCDDDGALGPLQQAMADSHSFQCAFCAPGFLMTAHCLLAEDRDIGPTRDEIREELSGNLCRCTGYQSIVDGVERAVTALVEARNA